MGEVLLAGSMVLTVVITWGKVDVFEMILLTITGVVVVVFAVFDDELVEFKEVVLL